MGLFRIKAGGRREQIAVAEQANADAQNALAEAHRRRPTVESRVKILRERRKRNGFGDDFTITMTPRGFADDAPAH